MALQFKRGIGAPPTLAAGEPAFDTTNKRLYVGDGTTNTLINLRSAGSFTLAQVSAADTSATLAASNAARVGLIVKNDSPQRLYLKYGAGADWQTSFTDWVE